MIYKSKAIPSHWNCKYDFTLLFMQGAFYLLQNIKEFIISIIGIQRRFVIENFVNF